MFFENAIRKAIDEIYMWARNVNRWADTNIYIYTHMHKSRVNSTDTYFKYKKNLL